MKIGDVSRRRRLADPVRMRWYAHHRLVRFSRRCLLGQGASSKQAAATAGATGAGEPGA
jgi:hypothetical protein